MRCRVVPTKVSLSLCLSLSLPLSPSLSPSLSQGGELFYDYRHEMAHDKLLSAIPDWLRWCIQDTRYTVARRSVETPVLCAFFACFVFTSRLVASLIQPVCRREGCPVVPSLYIMQGLGFRFYSYLNQLTVGGSQELQRGLALERYPVPVVL